MNKEKLLSAVVAGIPKACYENPTWKGLFYVLRDASIYLVVCIGLIATNSVVYLIPLWILAALSISALFILGHDAAHGSLFKSRKLSYAVGQLCMLPSLHLFYTWCYGHNRVHHGHTIRETMDNIWHPISPERYEALSAAERALHRFKWSAAGAGFYYLIDVWWLQMLLFRAPPKVSKEIQRDRFVIGSYFIGLTGVLIVAGVATGGSLLFGMWMWVKVFAIPFLLWNYSIGITVYMHHVSPSITWKSQNQWSRFDAQMSGTTILHIPRWLNFFYHNIFLHVPHHVDMRIPFYNLPAATNAIKAAYGDVVRERTLRVRDYIDATKVCKLFDFERGLWCDYSGKSPFVIERESINRY